MALNIKAAIKSLMGESLISSLFFGSKIIDTGNYERRDLHNVYKDSSAARLVIDKVVDSFVSIPVKWVDKDGKDVEGIYQQELLKSPNYLQTQTQFENAFITQYCIYDECFIDGGIEGVALNKGKRAELNIIQGQYVAFELDSNGKIVSYVNSYNQTKKVPLENIKSTIGNVLDPAVTQHATSKLITASKIIKKIEEGDKMDITAYGNKGANYLVTADGDVLYDKTQAANAQEQINDPSLKGGIRFMGAKAQVHDISKTPADLNILETSKDSRKLLALLYGVPIPLISEEASTRDNVITSEKTLALNNINATVFPSNSLSEVTNTYQHIVSNPPFHQGVNTNYQATETFLSGIHKNLKKKGSITIVANSFLRYQPIMEQYIGCTSVITKAQGFTIYHASKR